LLFAFVIKTSCTYGLQTQGFFFQVSWQVLAIISGSTLVVFYRNNQMNLKAISVDPDQMAWMCWLIWIYTVLPSDIYIPQRIRLK
jgi:hypothetical protein